MEISKSISNTQTTPKAFLFEPKKNALNSVKCERFVSSSIMYMCPPQKNLVRVEQQDIHIWYPSHYSRENQKAMQCVTVGLLTI